MGNIQEIPPSVLANWPEPNYEDPVRRSWMPIFAMIWQVASTILVWGRFYLRVRKLAGPFGWDDAFMLVAWMSSVAFTACAWVNTAHYGVDRHTWDVPVAWFPNAAMFAWLLQILMLLSTGATKASVLLFHRRLVTGTLARRWKLAIYFALAFHAMYLIGLLLGYVLICRPLRAYWMSYDYAWAAENADSYSCSDGEGLNPTIGVLSVVSDVYAVVLPFVILRYYQLDVPRSQRIGLNIIFATGLLVAGAGIGRTYYLIKLGTTYDTSWTGFDLLIWSIVELQLGIICACAPSLRAFFRRYLSATFSRSWGGSQSQSRSRGRSDLQGSSVGGGGGTVGDKEAEVEAIDLRCLPRGDGREGSSGESSPERREIRSGSVEGRARPVSGAFGYREGGKEGATESGRWYGRSREESLSGVIPKAQEAHSTV